VLGLWQGATENSTVCMALLDDLVERGLRTDQPYLFVLDGSKALRKAVQRRFGDRAVVQRCVVHKERNILSYLPDEYQGNVRQRLRAAWGMTEHAKAKAALLKLVYYLSELSASAQHSLEEGLDETLTLHRLHIPHRLRRSLLHACGWRASTVTCATTVSRIRSIPTRATTSGSS
jgi:transposase-like protein